MTDETRLELLKLVHRHGLKAHEVIDQAREYEKFLHEAVPASAPEKVAGGRVVKKSGSLRSVSEASGEPSK